MGAFIFGVNRREALSGQSKIAYVYCVFRVLLSFRLKHACDLQKPRYNNFRGGRDLLYNCNSGWTLRKSPACKANQSFYRATIFYNQAI